MSKLESEKVEMRLSNMSDRSGVWGLLLGSFLSVGCSQPTVETVPATTPSPIEATSSEPSAVSASELLNDPSALAFCYGGFRGTDRQVVPTVDQIKEDMRILERMGVKLVRTYNTQQFKHAENLLNAIEELRLEEPDFEMYVMLGAWIECASAWTQDVDHESENESGNRAEIEAAVRLAKEHPEVVKIVAVGNEAMVHWASQYFVRPAVILKWVNYLQGLKADGALPGDLWITSSDNFAAWGGLTPEYHTSDLTQLIEAVDYISLHTYPFHHTHYDPEQWGVPASEESLDRETQISRAMVRALVLAQEQYRSTQNYVKSLGIERQLHIGETGWASQDHRTFGAEGSQAADEVKAAMFYDAMRAWTRKENIGCFYFEAFDERWKDTSDARGSENHFGLFTLEGQAKYALWNLVDEGTFEGLTRDGHMVAKTHEGRLGQLEQQATGVPILSMIDRKKLEYPNTDRTLGEPVQQETYKVLPQRIEASKVEAIGQPSTFLKANVWEGTCGMVVTQNDVVRVQSGIGDWWGCALEFSGGGENLSNYAAGHLVFEIQGDMTDAFELGIQSGNFGAGTQVNAFVPFSEDSNFTLTKQWKEVSVAIAELAQTSGDGRSLDLTNVTSVLAVRGQQGKVSGTIEIRNVRWVRP